MSDTSNTPNEYYVVISDIADVFSAGEEAYLNSKGETLSEYGNVVIISASIPSGITVEMLEETYHDTFGNESGIILSINTADSTLNYYYTGEMSNTLADSDMADILSTSEIYAKEGRYYTAANTFLGETQSSLQPPSVIPEFNQMNLISSALLSVIIGLTITHFIVRAFYGKKVAKEEEMLNSIHKQYHLSNPTLEPTGQKILVNIPDSDGSSLNFIDNIIDGYKKL